MDNRICSAEVCRRKIKSFKSGEDSIDTLELARAAALAAADKKAENPVILKIGKLSSLADYFVICEASNSRSLKAISDEMQRRLKEEGLRPLGVEGNRGDVGWILIDWGSIIGHVFLSETREFYNLEKLWEDATRIEIA